MSTSLFTFGRQSLPLAEAMAAFVTVVAPTPGVALLYSPQRCRLATVAASAFHGPDGRPLDVTKVFEARVFNEATELRWLNDPGPERRHHAVILSERDHSGLLPEWRHEVTAVLETLRQTYLLWGEGTGRGNDSGRPYGLEWSELATARVGTLPVPVADVATHQRVLLHTVEYAVEQDHGNAVIFDERLLKLEVARG